MLNPGRGRGHGAACEMHRAHTDLSASQTSHFCSYKLHSLSFVLTFRWALYWPMYLLNLAFPLVSRWGRHVPSCRWVTDPNDPAYPVKTGLLTGLAPPAMTARCEISTSCRRSSGAVKHVWFSSIPEMSLFKMHVLHFRRLSCGLIISIQRCCLVSALHSRWFTQE